MKHVVLEHLMYTSRTSRQLLLPCMLVLVCEYCLEGCTIVDDNRFNISWYTTTFTFLSYVSLFTKRILFLFIYFIYLLYSALARP